MDVTAKDDVGLHILECQVMPCSTCKAYRAIDTYVGLTIRRYDWDRMCARVEGSTASFVAWCRGAAIRIDSHDNDCGSLIDVCSVIA